MAAFVEEQGEATINLYGAAAHAVVRGGPEQKSAEGTPRIPSPRTPQPLLPTDLRDHRRSQGLTLEQVAHRAHVSVSTVSRWETGRRVPGSADVRRYAAIVKAPLPAQHSSLTARDAIGPCRNLAPMRKHRGLTRRELAAALGVQPATIAHWECGRRRLPVPWLRPLSVLLSIDEQALPQLLLAQPCVPPPSALRRLRTRAGLDQRHVARRIGVTGSLVSQWERGVRRPSWPHVRKLANLYAVEIERVAEAVGLEPPHHLTQRRWTPEKWPEVLQDLLRWTGLTRKELASRARVHPHTISRWLAGLSRPDRARLLRLERGLGLPRGTLDMFAR